MAEKTNRYWNLRRFPSLEECDEALKHHQDGVIFWCKVRETVLIMAGRKPSDEADMVNPPTDE